MASQSVVCGWMRLAQVLVAGNGAGAYTTAAYCSLHMQQQQQQPRQQQQHICVIHENLKKNDNFAVIKQTDIRLSI